MILACFVCSAVLCDANVRNIRTFYIPSTIAFYLCCCVILRIEFSTIYLSVPFNILRHRRTQETNIEWNANTRTMACKTKRISPSSRNRKKNLKTTTTFGGAPHTSSNEKCEFNKLSHSIARQYGWHAYRTLHAKAIVAYVSESAE